MPAEPGALTAPVAGAPTGVRFDGETRWHWWGEDESGTDLVAARGGRALSWRSPSACREFAEAQGWPLDARQADGERGAVVDLQPAQDWLARRVLFPDPVAELSLWNWALDVAAGTGRSWNPRTRLHDACYRKLFAANVPGFFDLESFRPVWTPQQSRALRHVLADAVHVLRSARS